MRVVRSDGGILDATFSIDGGPGLWTLIYESSGGRAGGPNPRNLDYREGLLSLLRRLTLGRATLLEIRVDTAKTAGIPVELRRIDPPGFSLPIAMAAVSDTDRLRRSISVAARKVGQSPERASRRGGSSRRLAVVFTVPMVTDPDLLAAQLAGTGGAGEVDEIDALVNAAASQQRSGQGFLIDQRLRDALERHAVAMAIDAYRNEGWNVEYVGEHEAYDVLCRRADDELRVEVKGTTTAGDAVLLTPNEVRHARDNYPNVDLFIVSSIHVETMSAPGAPSVSGGRVTRVRGWDIGEGELRPIAYKYWIRPANGSGVES